MNYIKTYIRFIKRNQFLFTVNLVGLSVALSCILIVGLYAKKEFSYDRFYSKADRIYRATLESETGEGSVTMHPARTSGEWINKLKDYPAIEQQTNLVIYRNAIVKINDNVFYSEKTFATDSSFLEVFDVEVIKGDAEAGLKQPKMALITQSLSQKYFGTDDVIGKTLSITHQLRNEAEEYTIAAVIKDIPQNAHFHLDLLTSEAATLDDWAYSYFLAKPDADVQSIAQTITDELNNQPENRYKKQVHFQKLTDIHLHSRKSREVEHNGSFRSVVLLIAGALMVFLVALINFYNLSKVQIISETKTIRVKLINGATKTRIVFDKLKETVPLVVLSWFVSALFIYFISKVIALPLWQNIEQVLDLLLIIVLDFSLLVFLTALLATLSYKITVERQMVTKHYGSYKIPLMIQLVLSIITISGTMILYRQIHLINNLHPQSETSNMLVIPNVPAPVANKYSVFKEELLKQPDIEGVTAAMEAPGGNILDHFRFHIEGQESDENKSIKFFAVSHNFLEMMNIHAIAGTNQLSKPSTSDWERKAIRMGVLKMNNQPVDKALKKEVLAYKANYIINKSALKLMGFSKPEDAIGKRFKLVYNLEELFPEGEIVGVVPDLHYTSLFHKEEPMLITHKQIFSRWLIVRLNPKSKEKTLAKINEVWEQVYPEYPFRYQFINDSYRMVYQGEYTQTKVLSFFALVSILLSAIGIFALTQFTIQRRTKEIGIRKINGATIVQILSMLNKGFVRWVLIAFVIATPIAYYAMEKWLENFAYKTELSWWIFALSGLLAVAIAVFTVTWQSWRTATRNPVDALRYE